MFKDLTILPFNIVEIKMDPNIQQWGLIYESTACDEILVCKEHFDIVDIHCKLNKKIYK